MSIPLPLRTLRLLTAFTAVTAAYGVVPPLAAEVTYETRALSGQAAPGTEPGVSFSNFARPTINDAGQTAFRGTLSGTGVDGSNTRVIWSEAAGNIGNPGLVARQGDAAPGTAPGVLFRSLIWDPVLNDAGQTAFLGEVVGTGVDDSNELGIWSEAAGSTGNPALIARTGNLAPGTAPGVNFSNLDPPALNNAGQTAFFGTLTGTDVDNSNYEGLWSEAAGTIGNPGLVVRTGDAAPGTGPGVTFDRIIWEPIINDAGQTAFSGRLAGTGASGNERGIWSEAAGSIGNPGLVALEGDPAPGTEPGIDFLDLGWTPVLNEAGQTAFRGRVIGTGVNSFSDEAIWSETAGTAGNLRLVARGGDAALGTGPGINFGGLIQPILNDVGQTAFRGILSGTGVDGSNYAGIWSETAGSIGSPALVARIGDAAPGTEPGVTFSSLPWDPVLNNAGQIAFRGRLVGDGVTGANDRGIWATDVNGALTLIIREGDVIDVDNDPINEDLRTVNSFFTHIGENSHLSSFNDAGQLAFFATFNDGSSGIFVANTVAPILSGDYNGDGFVSQADLDLVLLNWGDTVLPDGFDADATADGDPFDGLISQNELDGVLLNWGDGNPPNLNAIPEPTTLALLAPALFATRRSGARNSFRERGGR